MGRLSKHRQQVIKNLFSKLTYLFLVTRVGPNKDLTWVSYFNKL